MRKMPLMLATATLTAISFAGVASASDNLIGFNFTTAASGTPDPQNWNRVSAADGTLSNVMDETGATTNVSITWGGGASGGFVYLSTATLAGDATPQYTYDLSGMTGYGFRSNGEFFIDIAGLNPNTPYEYWFVAYRGGSNIDNIVNVSDGNINNAFTFNQFILSTDNDGRFVVNTTNANSSMQWNDLSFTTMSSGNGTIRFEWAGDTQTTVIGAMAIRVIPTPAGLAILALAPFAVTRRRRH